MAERTMECPNGCDPAELQRDSWENPVPDSFGIRYGTRYTCHTCGFEADWNNKQGLMVNFADRDAYYTGSKEQLDADEAAMDRPRWRLLL